MLEEERKKRSTWRKSLSPGGGAGRGDDFAYAMPPAWHSEIVQSRQVCEGPLWCAAVSDGGVVACGGSDCLVTVAALGGGAGCPPDWRLPREALLLEERKLGGHGGPVFDVAFGPSSGSEETLVSVSADATARLWRGSGTALSCAMVFSHGSGVCACAFLGPECFATGGYDRNVRLWHLQEQRELPSPPSHSAELIAAARGAREKIEPSLDSEVSPPLAFVVVVGVGAPPPPDVHAPPCQITKSVVSANAAFAHASHSR